MRSSTSSRSTRARRTSLGAVVGLTIVAAASTGLLLHRKRALAASASIDCGATTDPFVLVDTASHRLALCEHGSARATFDVRLGHGGVGKRREGDGKTPLGRYPLEESRRSRAFGTFIPIGYPTEAQRREGFTGSSVGVHGPHRTLRTLRTIGRLLNAFDTTDGCVGLGSDDDIDAITRWIRSEAVGEIVLR